MNSLECNVHKYLNKCKAMLTNFLLNSLSDKTSWRLIKSL